MATFWPIPFLGGPLDGEELSVPYGLCLPLTLKASNNDGHYEVRSEHGESPYFEDPIKYVWIPERHEMHASQDDLES